MKPSPRFLILAGALTLLPGPTRAATAPEPAAVAAPPPAAAPVPAPSTLDRKITRQRAKVEAMNGKLQAEHRKLDRTIGRIVDVAVALRDYNQDIRQAMQELGAAYDKLLGLKRAADKERRALALLEDQKAAGNP